jgi:uncharacterized membrane protein
VDTRRAESFSDGVFAVAITILVFNLLPIADATLHQLTASTIWSDRWPAYLAYVVSFLTIGIMWLNHHTMMAQVSRVNRPVLVLNLFLLMGVVAIPFPTALVADHLTGPDLHNSQAKIAAVAYGLVMMAISVSYAAMWIYLAGHHQELGARSKVAVSGLSTVRFTIGNAGYVVATVVAFAAPYVALVIFGLLAVYYLFDHLPDPAGEPGEGGSGGGTAGESGLAAGTGGPRG